MIFFNTMVFFREVFDKYVKNSVLNTMIYF
jgi:hypothetical protein